MPWRRRLGGQVLVTQPPPDPACLAVTCPAPAPRERAGQPVLLPLTESLYVSGALESVDSVLLEVGTGYFVQVRRAA